MIASFSLGRPFAVASFMLGLTLCAGPLAAQDEAEIARQRQMFDSISWQTGPCIAKIGGHGQINVPQGFQYTGAEGARVWNELTQNPPDPGMLGVMMPSDNPDWFLVFEFDETGYVKDDDKDKLDAAAILSSIHKGPKPRTSSVSSVAGRRCRLPAGNSRRSTIRRPTIWNGRFEPNRKASRSSITIRGS